MSAHRNVDVLIHRRKPFHGQFVSKQMHLMLRGDNPLICGDDRSARGFPNIRRYHTSSDGADPGGAEYHVPEIALFEFVLRM